MLTCRFILFIFIALNCASAQAEVKKTQLRIVALAPHIVENLFAIGAGDQIVGTVEYADFPDAANKIPRLGGASRYSNRKAFSAKT